MMENFLRNQLIGGSHFVEYNDPLTDCLWGQHRLAVRPHCAR